MEELFMDEETRAGLLELDKQMRAAGERAWERHPNNPKNK